MANRGKDFEQEFRYSLENMNIMVERIPDKIYWTGYRIASEESRADFFAFKGGNDFKTILIECKATSTLRIDFKALKQHQKDALQEFEAFDERMKGYVAVNFYDKVSIRRKNICYMVPITVWTELEETLDRKSIPIKVFQADDRIIECPRIKGSVYDMTKWAASV